VRARSEARVARSARTADGGWALLLLLLQLLPIPPPPLLLEVVAASSSSSCEPVVGSSDAGHSHNVNSQTEQIYMLTSECRSGEGGGQE
jgi:hypothetical protein